MNWDKISGDWREYRGSAKGRWTRLTDDDLNTIRGDRELLIVTIQERYGYTRAEAEREVNEWQGGLKIDEEGVHRSGGRQDRSSFDADAEPYNLPYRAIKDTEWVSDPDSSNPVIKALRMGEKVYFNREPLGTGVLWQDALLGDGVVRFVHPADFERDFEKGERDYDRDERYRDKRYRDER
jgi:uncharacterized protein YjbJ (UPF0337 family)